MGLSAHGGSTHVSVCHPRPAASWSGLLAPVGLVPVGGVSGCGVIVSSFVAGGAGFDGIVCAVSFACFGDVDPAVVAVVLRE